MTAEQFNAGTYGTFILTGTNALTGSFAGFKAIGETVIASITVGSTVYGTPANYLGSATIADGLTFTVPFGGGIYITSITLTSGSLLMIKGS